MNRLSNIIIHYFVIVETVPLFFDTLYNMTFALCNVLYYKKKKKN